MIETMPDTGAAAMRRAMVTSQLRTNGVSDQRVVAAMASIAREAFVPASASAVAYRDTAIPLGAGRYLNPPMATGRLLTEAALDEGDRVLLIGAGGGYAAAVMQRIVAAVVAVEVDPGLVAIARRMIGNLRGVTLVEGPLAAGAPAQAPFDVLVIDGAVDRVPDELVDQVRVGGRVVAGLVDRGTTRLASGRRTEGGFAIQPFADTECAGLPGFAPAPRFAF